MSTPNANRRKKWWTMPSPVSHLQHQCLSSPTHAAAIISLTAILTVAKKMSASNLSNVVHPLCRKALANVHQQNPTKEKTLTRGTIRQQFTCQNWNHPISDYNHPNQQTQLHQASTFQASKPKSNFPVVALKHAPPTQFIANYPFYTKNHLFNTQCQEEITIETSWNHETKQ